MLDDQLTAKICIPKIILTICDARKKRSDEIFLYITVDVQHATNIRHHNMYAMTELSAVDNFSFTHIFYFACCRYSR